MMSHILIPTDGSECATAALDRAVSLAAQLQAKVTFLVATEPFRPLSAESSQGERVKGEFVQHQSERAYRILERATAVAAQAGVTSSVRHVEHGQPYETIIETARQGGVDIIAMGSYGMGGIRAVVLGSVTQKVLTHCHIPVLVYR
ncbi:MULTISPECIES: universal stress protein [unclassified Achromobacter]|uniref:universal stress protein n=1 Tax=unclassified Achromobacter TaxID=2626865 RepID=UPI0013034C56|nr:MULTISPECIES: universal stress protein [unclassified Achromobacter]